MPLLRLAMGKFVKWGVLLLLLAAVSWGAWTWLKPKNEIAYLTEPVKRTDILQTVSATGKLQQLNWLMLARKHLVRLRNCM